MQGSMQAHHAECMDDESDDDTPDPVAYVADMFHSDNDDEDDMYNAYEARVNRFQRGDRRPAHRTSSRFGGRSNDRASRFGGGNDDRASPRTCRGEGCSATCNKGRDLWAHKRPKGPTKMQ